MKKTCIIFLLSIIISLTAGVALNLSNNQKGGGMSALNYVDTQYLRMHIRANSNDEAAQQVKYQVRDKLVEYLTPIVAQCSSRDLAAQILAQHTKQMQTLTDQLLKQKGFDYTATIELRNEDFPTRKYGETVLPAGEYLALIVELGEGKGDNWWCVVYPPLCFVGTPTTEKNIVYKSKILQIIREFQQTDR